jgi:hypothetical protein
MKTILLLFSQFIFLTPLFSEINAHYNDDKVEIYWSETTSPNIQHFIIERSENGKFFEEIMEVNEVRSEVEYFEIDYNPPVKVAYYRIKKIDKGGDINYSKTILVKNYNKLKLNKNFGKTLKNYKGHNVLVVLKNKKGKEFYLKVDVTEYKKKLFAMSKTSNVQPGAYLVIASSDDILLNKKIELIGKETSNDSFLTLNKK